MTAQTISMIIALGAVPIFYIIYMRHFVAYYHQKNQSPQYSKHIESFLYGVCFALVLVLSAPLIVKILPGDTTLNNAFIRAALIEKGGLMVMYLMAIRYYPRFSILEGIVSGIALGAGFSLVENIIYVLNYGPTVIIPRLLFSAPVHLTTCGMMGYYLSVMLLSNTRLGKFIRLILAIVVPILFHGIFDKFLFDQGMRLFYTGPLVLLLVVFLELIISRAKLIPDKGSLKKMNLRMEDWFLKYHQPRFERWILNSMGTPSDVRVALFRAHRSKILWLLSLLLFIGAWASLPFNQEITELLGLDLGSNISLLLTTVYPVSLGMTLLIVGILNPDFFRFNIVRLPIIFDTVLHLEDREESIISFDLTPINCFLRSFESLGQSELGVHFEFKKFKSTIIRALPVWENHEEKSAYEPTGTIVSLLNPGFSFYFFIVRYFLFRIWKGIVFNLKLPGFESIRRLFMTPDTVMQKEVVYHPDALVFQQGDSINSFYFIKKGEVQIIRTLDSGEEIILETLGPSQIFNEMSLLGDTRRTITARCLTRCVLAEAQSDNLEALIKNDPEFALALILKLLNRVDSTQNSLTQTIEYLQNLIQIKEKRIKNAVLLLALSLGFRPKKGMIKLIMKKSAPGGITKKDIAEYLKKSFLPEDKTAENQEKTKAIEKMINGLRIDISHGE